MSHLQVWMRMADYPRFWLDFWRYHQAGGSAPLAEVCAMVGESCGSQSVDHHYVVQAWWAARRIRAAGRGHHVDVGSQVMFVVMMSAWLPLDYYDIRPIDIEVPNLQQRFGDLCALPLETGSVTSLSCLHVIEHIGLGRYGDLIDPDGSRKAAAELSRVLAPGGDLFVSCPVGRERVVFNAHRVFDPATVVAMFAGCELMEFSFVDDGGAFREHASLGDARALEYGCGFFLFRGPTSSPAC
ncbi:MAG: DUF268 domain-containing protein [Thermoleophilia bacterium]|nr:DUF268 domain-containing protein [Thermoleophilia bacterium]